MPLGPERALAAADLLQRHGGEIESTVRGRSMGSTLPAGTRIRIGRQRPAGYPEGVVVAFLAGGTLVGHRVVGHCRDRRGRHALLTRGDGTIYCDPPIDPALVVGEVIAWESRSAWHAVPPAPGRGHAGVLVAAAVLGCVRALASMNRPLASRLVEAPLSAVRSARALLSRLSARPA
jgi:hypothetical protein